MRLKLQLTAPVRQPSISWRPAYVPKLRQWTRSRCDRRRKLRLTHEIGIDAGSARPPFGDRPDDQTLPSSHVAGDEHPGHRAHVPMVAAEVAALVEGDAELIEPRTLL